MGNKKQPRNPSQPVTARPDWAGWTRDVMKFMAEHPAPPDTVTKKAHDG